MLDPEELKRAKAVAVRYLSYRDRSEFEVSERLGQEEFAKNTVQETIDWLTGLHYLDDERFALAWSRSRIAAKNFGEYRLRRELSAKGLASETIEQTLRIVYSESNEEDLALVCAQKKLSHLKGTDPKTKSRRLAQFLQRKGFASDTVFKTVRKLIPNKTDHELSAG